MGDTLWFWGFIAFIAGIALLAVANYFEKRMGDSYDGDKHLVCPHCGTRGYVTTYSIKEKTGISGAKAAGAIVTGGWSVLATGLAKKTRCTKARCGRCGVSWTIA